MELGDKNHQKKEGQDDLGLLVQGKLGIIESLKKASVRSNG